MSRRKTEENSSRGSTGEKKCQNILFWAEHFVKERPTYLLLSFLTFLVLCRFSLLHHEADYHDLEQAQGVANCTTNQASVQEDVPADDVVFTKVDLARRVETSCASSSTLYESSSSSDSFSESSGCESVQVIEGRSKVKPVVFELSSTESSSESGSSSEETENEDRVPAFSRGKKTATPSPEKPRGLTKVETPKKQKGPTKAFQTKGKNAKQRVDQFIPLLTPKQPTRIQHDPESPSSVTESDDSDSDDDFTAMARAAGLGDEDAGAPDKPTAVEQVL